MQPVHSLSRCGCSEPKGKLLPLVLSVPASQDCMEFCISYNAQARKGKRKYQGAQALLLLTNAYSPDL